MNIDIMKRETFAAIVAQVNKTMEDFSNAIDILENAQMTYCPCHISRAFFSS